MPIARLKNKQKVTATGFSLLWKNDGDVMYITGQKFNETKKVRFSAIDNGRDKSQQKRIGSGIDYLL